MTPPPPHSFFLLRKQFQDKLLFLYNRNKKEDIDIKMFYFFVSSLAMRALVEENGRI